MKYLLILLAVVAADIFAAECYTYNDGGVTVWLCPAGDKDSYPKKDKIELPDDKKSKGKGKGKK
jgi:hypothetical protein